MANPFSTRFIRPGSIPFLFSDSFTLGDLLARFRRADMMGQIVGPHGCGKTTLGLELCRHLQSEFDEFRHLTVRRKNFALTLIQINDYGLGSDQVETRITDLFSHDLPATNTGRRTLYFVDGWERISKLNRYLFTENCRRSHNGLLVTTHRRTSRLELLQRITPNRSVFFQLVRYLQRDCFFELDGTVAEQALDDSQDNFREAFMMLYDEFEREKRSKLRDSSYNV